MHRVGSRLLLGVGLGLFLAASIACAAAQSLAFLIGARTVQGVGAALLLAGALPVLGRARWTAAATFGLALGPALGGVLTQAFDWRAIFVAQAPVAALGAGRRSCGRTPMSTAEEGWSRSLTRTLPANACLGLLFGALVGALFLAVLLVISVWDYSPIAGAGIVSALPVAALAMRPLRLSPLTRGLRRRCAAGHRAGRAGAAALGERRLHDLVARALRGGPRARAAGALERRARP